MCKPILGQDTLYIEKDFLDYWYAETGSWWVFKRTDTVGVDIYDTMRVVYHEREIKFNNIINGRSAFEKIDIYITHSNPIFKHLGLSNSLVGKYDASIRSSYSSDVNYINYSWVGDNKNVFYLPVDSFGRGLLDLEFPFIISLFDSRNLPYIVESIDTTINTPYKKLSKTLKIKDVNNFNIRFYISKSVGISRMEIQGGQIWELIDCNIIQ